MVLCSRRMEAYKEIRKLEKQRTKLQKRKARAQAEYDCAEVGSRPAHA